MAETPRSKKRILIADDHPVIRAGLKQIIDDADDLMVADICENCRGAIQKIQENNYDAVVLDITLPDGSGLDLLKLIKSMRPNLPILILSMHPENHYALRTLRAGAAGYLTKKSAEGELLEALRTVCSGRKYVSGTQARRFISELQGGESLLLHEKLSDREYQVVVQISLGKTLQNIADHLHLNVKTVASHRASAMRKMNMQSDTELVRYFIENNLH